MRAVIQRVSHASVTIEGKVKSSIQQGYVILLGVCDEDTMEDNQAMNSNLISAEGTYQISAVTPTTLEITINSAVNLCTENAAIWFKLESVGRTVQGVSDVSLTCKCDSTVSRVPCTTYYYV